MGLSVVGLSPCTCYIFPAKALPWDEEATMYHWEHTEIVEIHRRRYMLKNNALEIFLINGKTMLLAFDSTKVRGA